MHEGPRLGFYFGFKSTQNIYADFEVFHPCFHDAPSYES